MSLHKQPGKPNWLCAYTIWDAETGKGRRVFSFHEDVEQKASGGNRTRFMKKSRKARARHADGDTARQIIAEPWRRAHASPEPRNQIKSRYTINEWTEKWLESKKNEVEPSTLNRYKCVIDRFIAFLGANRNHDLAALDSSDVLEFRDR